MVDVCRAGLMRGCPFHVDVVDVGCQQWSTYAEIGSMHGRPFHVDVGVVGSTWADSMQMVHVHHDEGGLFLHHGVRGHEEFRHHRFLPCKGGWMPRTQQHRVVNGCGPRPDRSVMHDGARRRPYL
jgi:hypothetical protein